MEVLASKDLQSVRVAKGGEKVYKDECIYCFNSPVSTLFIVLSAVM